MQNRVINCFILAGGLLLTSCNSFWKDDQVPEDIKVSFAEMYPSVKKVDWDVNQNTYEAGFKMDGREREVRLDASGALIQVSEEIDKNDLPANILEFIAKEYNAYAIDEAHRVQHKSRYTYTIELEHRQKEINLVFNEAGELIDSLVSTGSGVVKQQASIVPVHFLSHRTVNVLGKPAAHWELPKELLEISGIAVLPDGRIACVQDEAGVIFIYNTRSNKVEQKIDFAGPGDYEGIVLLEDEAIILRSDATLFRVKNYLQAQPSVTKHQLGLAPTQDTEGLAYDAEKNRLLIAGKGYDNKYSNKKAIFAYNLQSNSIASEPVILINLPHKALQSKKKKAKSVYDGLQTASLEYHPHTNELYLLDAENSRMMVLNEQGGVSKITNLDTKILPKAEGLAFGPNGEMYIASEGIRKKSGVITLYRQGL